ncbi:MAG: hypothetical protein LBN19_00650 [Endomicrobium sp.]|jgi:dTDP-4-dehydrorhamnose reductase|nr:hypothetical protein [Endomicrobium sp.]
MTKRFLQLIYVKDVANAVTSCLENKKTDNNTYYLANSAVCTWSENRQNYILFCRRKDNSLPVADFVFKFAAMAAGSLSYITKKPAVLNRQKIVEML